MRHALDTKRTPLRYVAVIAAMAISGTVLAQDEMTLLRQQMKQLQERLDQLERSNAQRPASKPDAPERQAITGGDTPGSFMLPGSNTSVTIGGYVKGSVIYSDRSAGSASPADELLIPSLIPLSNVTFPPAEKGKIKLVGKETRLALRTFTPSALGPVTTYVEADLAGTGGSETATNAYALRMRHAWGSVGNLGFGQTWTNILNPYAVPETLDFAPSIGILGAVRQGQVRWTQPIGMGEWSVALENPETVVAATSPQPDNDKFPDLNAKLSWRVNGGAIQVAGFVRKLRSNVAGMNSANGKGITASIGTQLTRTDKVMFGLGYGEGVGRYWGAGFPDAIVVNGRLQAMKTSGGFVGIRHIWTPTLRSSLDYSWVALDLPSGAPATLDKKYASAHANLIWNVTKSAELGIEYLWAKRVIGSGIDGKLNRFIFSAKYAF